MSRKASEWQERNAHLQRQCEDREIHRCKTTENMKTMPQWFQAIVTPVSIAANTERNVLIWDYSFVIMKLNT